MLLDWIVDRRFPSLPLWESPSLPWVETERHLGRVGAGVGLFVGGCFGSGYSEVVGGDGAVEGGVAGVEVVDGDCGGGVGGGGGGSVGGAVGVAGAECGCVGGGVFGGDGGVFCSALDD